MVSKKQSNHYDLKEIENYRRTKTIPKGLAVKGKKTNFRQTAKRFSIKNRQLHYKESRIVIADKVVKSTSFMTSAHLGRTATYKNVAARLFLFF